jgi:hypothetical protein
MSRHTLSHADELFFGNAQYNPYQGALRGIKADLLTFVDLGAPIVADPDALIDAATSTELPNNETVTYDFPGTVSPQDNVAGQSGVLATPRNITVNTAHASSVVAMTITVHGRDVYGDLMSEEIAVAATGTSQVDAGLKAFKSVHQITIASAGNAESNTVDIGFGDVLGLPFRIENAMRVVGFYETGALEVATLGTLVAADDTTPTAVTGDVRGTYNPSDTLDGTVTFGILLRVDATDKEAAFGVDNFYSGEAQ